MIQPRPVLPLLPLPLLSSEVAGASLWREKGREWKTEDVEVDLLINIPYGM